MTILDKLKQRNMSSDTTPRNSADVAHVVDRPAGTHPVATDLENHPQDKITIMRPQIILMAMIVSIGGLIFGYDTGQISGFVAMDNFLYLFGDDGPPDDRSFSNVREGTIVGLLSIGTLVGVLFGAPIADKYGRKVAIIFWNIAFIIGVLVQITTVDKWYQIAIGRLIAGFGVGGLSVLTPMYQSETAPRQIRGALVSCYQLFITFGIFLAYCINYGTESLSGVAEWKIPMGVGFIFPLTMAIGILFLRESPRWDYRQGNVDAARKTIALSYGVPEDHWEVQREFGEIKRKFDTENSGGKHPWHEVFTGPRMAYRTLLGISLMAIQQLTGANYFFYYGTQIFESTGLSNSYVTSMILGGINFGTTFLALYVVEHFGRRKALIGGALWMFVCLMIFSSVGTFALNTTTPEDTPKAGAAMVTFAAIFIFGYAATWGPIIWVIVGELFPSRYRAKAMGFSIAGNWTFNFLLSFFTPFITADIEYAYGYIFAGCCFVGAVVVYFFVCETQDRTIEETDTMYILHVKPWQSSNWEAPVNEDLVTTDDLNLTTGARDIRKDGPAEQNEKAELEEVPM